MIVERSNFREIVIKYPITCLDPNVNFGGVSVIRTEKLWFIREKKGELMFSIVTPVRLSVDTKLGEATIHEGRINFRLNEIDWVEGSNPVGFDRANAYGSCNLYFIKIRKSILSISN